MLSTDGSVPSYLVIWQWYTENVHCPYCKHVFCTVRPLGIMFIRCVRCDKRFHVRRGKL